MKDGEEGLRGEEEAEGKDERKGRGVQDLKKI